MRKFALMLASLLFLNACNIVGVNQPEAVSTAAEEPLEIESAPNPTGLPTINLPLTPTYTFVLPTLTPYPEDRRFSLGQSVEGRDIWAWQFGQGPRTIVLVGGIHGGFEGNTVVLSEEIVDYFRQHPEDILPRMRLVIIPVANPDGLRRGIDIEGRFNAHGVDLNRNWGCEWSPTAVLRDIQVNSGPRAFSEPESLALRSYFVAEPPDAVIFYHSAAGGIFLGQCRDTLPPVWLGKLLRDATGYPYHTEFNYYEVSGDATNWLVERGIPSAVIELYSKDDTEFDINLKGVMALQCYFALGKDNGDTPATPNPTIQRNCS